MSADALARYAAELVDGLEDKALLAAGADAAAEVMRQATARRIGGDLRMSRYAGGPVRIETDTSKSSLTVTMSGATYALADKGRRRARPARARRGSALATPWGPRVSVKGSRWRGFDITDGADDRALDAAADAIVDAIEWG